MSTRRGAHSLRWGMETLILVFCTILAWFLRWILMMEGASLHGSPSTCMGMDLKVVRVTSLHWWSRSPCPPTCSVAWTQTTTTTTGQQHKQQKQVRNTNNNRLKILSVVIWCGLMVWCSLTRDVMVKPMTSIQPSSWRCGSKSWWSPGWPHGTVPAQYL